MSSRRARATKNDVPVDGVFKLSFPEVTDSSSNQGRKRHFQSASKVQPDKPGRNATVTFTSPQPETSKRTLRQPASARVPASPAFNQPQITSMFKQSTPMAMKTADRTNVHERKRSSPMKVSMYKTPEKKKRIYSSDEEELEFSPSGRRMPIEERRVLLQNTTQWSARVDQEERFHGVYVKSVERLKRRLLSESLQSVDSQSTCSEMSETSLDLSSYEIDEAVLTRRQKQIAYGKNTAEYEYYARRLDKMARSRKDPQTPDKFDRVSRRRFDGRIRTWKIQIHRWFEDNAPSAEGGAKTAAVVADENTVTVQGQSEGTMTEAPNAKHMQSSPIKPSARVCATQNYNGFEDESAVDAFQSPKKAAIGKTTGVHTELTCDLAGFGICTDSQSTLTGPPAQSTRSRARLVFS